MLQSLITGQPASDNMQRSLNPSKLNNTKGFTLVELMIAVFLTGIAVVGIYKGYVSFSTMSDAQEQMIEMQQNLRIGMWRLEKDLRRAGSKEEDDNNPDNGLILATANTIEFSMDLGGTNKLVSLEPTDLFTYDSGDGDVDDVGERLSYSRRGPDSYGSFGLYRNDENLNPSGTGDQIISNLEALDFAYFLDSGSVLTGVTLGANDRKEVRSIEATLVVRTSNEDYRHNDQQPYTNAQGLEILPAPTGDDRHFRRRSFSKRIFIRNLGL